MPQISTAILYSLLTPHGIPYQENLQIDPQERVPKVSPL